MIEELQKQDRDLIRAKINSETAKIPWKELQRFFAGGNTLLVATELDLVDVACAFHQDEANIEMFFKFLKILLKLENELKPVS